MDFGVRAGIEIWFYDYQAAIQGSLPLSPYFLILKMGLRITAPVLYSCYAVEMSRL